MPEKTDSCNIATFIYDEKSFIYFSPCFADLIGVTVDKLKQSSLKDIIDSESYGEILKLIELSKQNSKPFYLVKRVMLKRKSKVETSAKLIVEAHTGSSTLYGSLSEISHSKLQSSDLELDSFLKISRLMDDTIVPMLCIDVKVPKVAYANKAAALFYGYEIEKLIDLPLEMISTLPKDMLLEELEYALKSKKTFFVSKHKLASGEVCDVNESINKIVVAGTEYLFDIITDITRRKQLERLIEEKNSSLVELNLNLSKTIQENKEEMKIKERIFTMQARYIVLGEIVNFIISGWKTPIENISLMIQDLEDRYHFGGLDKEEFDTVSQEIASQTNYIDSSLSNISLFYSSVFKNSSNDIYQMSSDAFELLKWQLIRLNISYSLNCNCEHYLSESCGVKNSSYCPKNLLNLLCDKNEYKQMITSILINSVDAIIEQRAKGALLESDGGLIFLSIDRTQDETIITIDNNGGGVTQDTIDNAFDPYFTTKQSGSGIGLFMSREYISTAFKGKMTLSNHGDGVRVAITLPR